MNNIAQALALRASEQAGRIAMHFPIAVEGRGDTLKIRYRDLSFAELDRRSNQLAAGLLSYDIGKGARTVVMLRPGPEFFIAMFALLKIGAVPVLVDPGIDKRALKACLAQVNAQAFIGISLAHCARVILGWGKGSIRQFITLGRRWFWSGLSWEELEARGGAKELAQVQALMQECSLDDPAAILFTSGSTGVPKGVCYLHRHFIAQVALLREAFQIEPGSVNLPTFPPFALFDPALGCTSVIPSMDPTRPASADPRKLISAIEQFHVSQMFGSPALLKTLVRYCKNEARTIPSLRKVMSAGAPVAPALLQEALTVLPNAQLFTPYGATEALPVAIAQASEVLGANKALSESGAGICVGLPLAANQVRIIAITDAAIPNWADVQHCAVGEIGEITVRGPSVTHSYYGDAEKTALAKINEGDAIVHRMGDLGYFDAHGALWFCGRKSQRVQTPEGCLYTEQIEAIFNASGLIARSALVGVGERPNQRAVLVFEAWPQGSARNVEMSTSARVAALQAVAQSHALCQPIKDFLCYPKPFPVDIRHNAKIGRETLAKWASQQARPRH